VPAAAPHLVLDDRVLRAVGALPGRLTPRTLTVTLRRDPEVPHGADLEAPSVRAALDRQISIGHVVVFHDAGQARLALSRGGQHRLARHGEAATDTAVSA